MVAQKGETLIIVEVKARRRAPGSSVTMEGLLPWKKRQALKRGATAFLSRNRVVTRTMRFDLAVVCENDEAGHGPASVRYYVDVLS